MHERYKKTHDRSSLPALSGQNLYWLWTKLKTLGRSAIAPSNPACFGAKYPVLEVMVFCAVGEKITIRLRKNRDNVGMPPSTIKRNNILRKDAEVPRSLPKGQIQRLR
jgi:hypothetical protein